MIVRVSRVSPLSLAKIVCCLQGMVGLMTGILFSLMAISNVAYVGTEGPPMETLFGVWSFLILPVANALIGFISGWLIAMLYNFLTQYVGSIEVELES